MVIHDPDNAMRSALADEDVAGRADDLAVPRMLAPAESAPRIHYRYWAVAILVGLMLWAGIIVALIKR